MLALAAALIFALSAFGAIEDTENVTWLLVGLALWAAHFGVTIAVPRVWERRG